jgi:hypothetical protein
MLAVGRDALHLKHVAVKKRIGEGMLIIHLVFDIRVNNESHPFCAGCLLRDHWKDAEQNQQQRQAILHVLYRVHIHLFRG